LFDDAPAQTSPAEAVSGTDINSVATLDAEESFDNLDVLNAAATESEPSYIPPAPRPPRSKDGSRDADGHKWTPDPEEQYAKYLESAAETNRRETERKAAEKQKAIDLREEQLAELSAIVRKDKPSKGADKHHPKHPAKTGSRPLNVRNIAAVGLGITLVVFVVLILLINSSRSDLAEAQDRIAQLETEIEGIVAINNNLAQQLADYQSRLQAQGQTTVGGASPDDTTTDDTTDDTNGSDETESGDETQAVANFPNTIINAAGQMVYTAQPGDNFFAIALRFLGDGSRYPEILAINGLTSTVLRAGDTIIIP